MRAACAVVLILRSALARVSKDEAVMQRRSIAASWFETALRASSP
jgi:hypothetical protein